LQYFSPTLGEDHWDILLNSYSDLQRFFPKIENANFSSYISGLSSYTPDGEIILGSIKEIDGFYVAAGDCGSGVSLSGGIGSVMSELILDGRSHLDIESFKADRFGKLDPFNSEFLKQCAKARSAKSRK
jgi:4-methylaminobutanoate oxidase (formaldehyde-forming)